MEVIYTFIETKKLVNRGFLIGPYCTIYGCGCFLLNLLLTNFKENPVILFLLAILVCSILEYTTSYLMERFFKARWWDYSERKFNLNGRICAGTMLPFGFLGLFVIYVLNPFVTTILGNINSNILNIITIIILIIFIVDNIFSYKMIYQLKDVLATFERDATEQITSRVKEVFKKKGILQQRIINAYPSIIAHKDRLIEKIRGKINVRK